MTTAMVRGRARHAVAAVWAVLFLWGLVGVVQRLTAGHAYTAYGSYVPWGLWVSAYIYFIGLSAGAFLLSSLVYVFRLKDLQRVGRVALFVAALTLGMALVSIWFDLGHMARFYEVFTRPNFKSLMAWMVWLYTAYVCLILAELWFETRCDLDTFARRGGPLAPVYRALALGWRCPESPEALAACHAQSRRWLRVLGSIGVPLAVTFHGGVGALFATVAARPYWHSALYPIFFLTGALLSGGGLLLAVVAGLDIVSEEERARIVRRLTRFVVGLLLFDLVLEWSEFSIPLWYGVGEELDVLKTVLFGPYWWVFWIVHLLMGAGVPLWLLLRRPGDRRAVAWAGGLVALTYMAVRLNLVIPAQLEPALRGLERAFVDARLVFHYVPSLHEWSVVAFIVSTGAAVFYLGMRFLPLVPVRAEEGGA
ncbi:Menaquinone reductase, integral membrane subunit [bacterium HR33]|nr:Menaquinone reductase, integral membrane subunit [bacterium HR33]